MAADQSGTLLKILASLVSAKAAIQYVSTALCLVFFWGFLNQELTRLGAPPEHISLIALLLSAGIGSLIGGLVYQAGNSICQKIGRLLEEKAARSIKALHEARLAKEEQEKASKFLEEFALALPYMYMWKKLELYGLLQGQACLNTDYVHIDELIQDKYILKLASPSVNRAVCVLNPIIYDHVNSYWREKVKRDMEEFVGNLNEHKLKAVDVMRIRDSEFKGPVSKQFIEAIATLTPWFSVEGKDSEGFVLSLFEPYNSALSLHFQEDLLNEVYISYSWVE